MPYIPHNDADRAAMLKAIGVSSLEDLFRDVPAQARYPEINLPAPMSEPELLDHIGAFSQMNADLNHFICFLGAGAYRHFIPSVVDHIVSRSEFYTAYTPYQPEISQGTLQAIFEYQSMICALTGMEVANASHYDGATAVAEAIVMAYNVQRKKRNKVVMSPYVHPEYRATARTYVQGLGLEIVGDDRRQDLDTVLNLVDEQTACVVTQTPNFLGEIEDLRGVGDRVHAKGALWVVVADPISLGLFKAPGDYGADIVVGEGQPLGNPLSFGGPYLGFFATRERFVHKMAGRLVGETVDAEGRRGFVLTLSAREQHIRRERATSNICSNEALNALAAAVYLAAVGKCGLRRIAELCYHKAHYAAKAVSKVRGYSVVTTKPFFKEFVVRCPMPVSDLNDELLEWGIVGGYDLGRDYPDLANHMLLCVTERNSRAEIDYLAKALREVAK
ncbi:MAG: aminomethyl-transferring glycine dehydrogenase subunit GcvPA [Chloroflexi bacterium]|nr:aminomethyl-transferring glycine dehydrogenase subunit GcvPA [Chloroflexota bacterium]